MKFKVFFERDNRRRAGENNLPVDITNNIVDKVFNEIILPYKDKFLKQYNEVEDHPLLRHIRSYISGGQNGTGNVNDVKNCDQIKFEYLKDVAQKTNDDYFVFVFKFVLLFRECINKFKKLDGNIDKEYCEVQGAEAAPDLCNEFITDFMESNDYFGMNSDDNKTEFIEVIQHYCHWLFDNGYTSSRLTLLS